MDRSITNRISQFFEQDHREIDAIYDKIRFGNTNEGLVNFEIFSDRLDRHIGWEEEILFPAVSEHNLHLAAGPIRVMKLEHEAIRDNKSKAHAAFRVGEIQRANDHCDVMLAILKQHNLKEERILYPACDQILDISVGQEILRRVEREKNESQPK